jgi:putative ABC transport system permease protein
VVWTPCLVYRLLCFFIYVPLFTPSLGSLLLGGGGAHPAHVDPIFVPSDLLRVWSLSLLLSIAAGIMPAWKASRLSPLEALRRT